MKPSALLLGTRNQTKVLYYSKFFNENFPDCVIYIPDELGIAGEPEENAETLEANARLKARYYFEKSGGLPTLADDAGFEIPALGNFPGVASRRFSGHYMDDEEVITGILSRMKALRGAARKARMSFVIALLPPDRTVQTVRGSIEGTVPPAPNAERVKGFPYRSLLYVDSLGKWFADLTEEDELRLGYRAAALEQLKRYLI